jgi:pimeloyl-ACP methyl ester carboxylesterase
MVRRLALNGVALACDDEGQGPPVLLLHGLGVDRRSWRLQRAALVGAYRVVSVDLRGHGDSSRVAESYAIPQLAADVAALIEALALPATHVVGLSLGGMVALQLAIDRPELVRSLVIINSGPSVRPRTLREAAQLAARLVLTWTLGPAGLARPIARRLFPAAGQEPLRRELEAQIAAQPRRSYRLLTHAIFTWSVEDRLGRIRCPVLVVCGDRDYTPVERKQEYVRRLRDARLVVIEDSGHATPLDQPEKLNDVLLQFLAG